MKLRRPSRVNRPPLDSPTRARVRAFQTRLETWFAAEGREFPWREAGCSLYVQILTEVLLQQTRAESVSVFLPRFTLAYPDWHALATADTRKLQRALKPLGLWRRRSIALKSLARSILARQNRWPTQRAELEQMPAVGQYVASAVLIFAHRQPEPLLDVNMARVIERYFGPRTLADIRDDPYLQSLARLIVRHPEPSSINWAILDLGALICTANNPRCSDCPLRRGCRYANQMRAADFRCSSA